MFALGNSVRGGKVYGDWKGLRDDQLNEGRDLAVTTDFRDVFAEAAYKQMKAKDLSKLFPEYAASQTRFKQREGQRVRFYAETADRWLG